MATKIKALQQWCRRMTDGYRDVNIKDFTTSWRDGLAFCAMIHRFRPDLMYSIESTIVLLKQDVRKRWDEEFWDVQPHRDYDALSKENVYDNNHLAFTVAEQELDIPAFLEAADMVALRTPDKLSVITYVSQYYNKLHSLPQLGGPGVREKTAPSASAGTKRHQKCEPLSEPEPKKQPPARQVDNESKTKGKSLGDKCAICKNKVYLLERHIEGGQLYHRSCYRHSDLSPTGKVYTRSPFLSPSLHGKDGGNTPTSKSSASVSSLDKVTDVSRTYVVEDKHGLKRPLDDVRSDDKSKKTDVQKFLFSDRNKTSDKLSDQKKFENKTSGLGKGDEKRQRPPELKIPTKQEIDKTLSPTPKFDARAFEKHSMDFLSGEKEAKDVKSQKRQLPLIFQKAESAGDSATDKSRHESENKPSSSTSKVGSGFQAVPLSANKAESKTQSSGNKLGSKSKNSVVTEKEAVTSAKSASGNKFSESSTGPVAKPRHVAMGKKVFEEKMDTSEPVQQRAKSPPFPRPAPRISLSQAESGQKSEPNRTKSPPGLRKAPPRPKSPARNLSPEPSSPPPLPSTAPPPLPLTAPPSASPHPSPRHRPSSPSVSKETGAQKNSREAATKKSADAAKKSPSQGAPSVDSSVLSSSRSKDSAVSSSDRKDKAPAHSKPLPHILISDSKNNSSEKTVPSSKVSSSVASGGSTVPSTFTSKSTISVTSSKRHEEPMDIDTAVSKARSQHGEEPVAVMVVPVEKDKQEKTTLTGLLKSLAHVRSTLGSTSTTNTIISTSTHTTSKHSSSADKPRVSESKSSATSGFVASKINRLQTKDTDKKAVSGPNLRSKNDPLSPRDIEIIEVTGNSSSNSNKPGAVIGLNADKNKDTKSKISPRLHDASANKKAQDRKLGETVTVTLNTGSEQSEDHSKPKMSVLSNLELKLQNGKSSDHVPLWKKNLAESHTAATNKPLNKKLDSTDNDTGVLPVPGKRDRAKSAADVLSVKTLSSTSQKTAAVESPQPPPFMQVKLRESSNSTSDRKERAKSAGNILENSSGAKPEWQLEAERRIAALRDVGFVDPENKKSTGSESPVEDMLEESDQKEEPEEVGAFQKLAGGFSPRKEDVSQVKLKGVKKDGEQIVKEGKDSHAAQPNVISLASKQPPAAVKEEKDKTSKPRFNLNLKGILKSEEKQKAPPAKPERQSLFEEKAEEPKLKPTPQTAKTPSPRVSPKETEAAAAKKKIAVMDEHVSCPPPRPSTPPRPNRKKVSVDVTFDFNSSNSTELTPEATGRPAPLKLTPPARPPPPKDARRSSMSPGRLSAIELQQQLLDIDSQLSELELRGRHLEDSIRSVAAEEEDDVMMEWFQLVTEKNELVRQETDLVYMSREQDLEDEQSQIESQLRYILSKEEGDKSFEEQQEEGYLIQRKLDIVDQRNSIVDSMDEDRLRYEEEDRDIAQMMREKGFKKDSTPPKDGKNKSKEKKRTGSSIFYT